MARLYFSERTYHRRRRAGIRSVAKSLRELDAHSQDTMGDRRQPVFQRLSEQSTSI